VRRGGLLFSATKKKEKNSNREGQGNRMVFLLVVTPFFPVQFANNLFRE
jgi:hypothetical protein